MTDEEQFERWVVEAADTYRRPPAEIPREEMWAAIQAGVGVTRPAPRRWSIGRMLPGLAAAAVLVVIAYRVGVTTGVRQGATSDVARSETATGSVVYDVATRALLDRAEVLLTSTQSPGAVTTDSAMTRWARDVLGETRLLLDSPAAAMPERRQLLEDLELLLAQLVRVDAAATPDDRALLDRSLRQGELLTRMRSTVPALVRGT